MIYSCLHIDTSGPDGTSLRPKPAADQQLSYVGQKAQRHWYVGLAATEQYAELDLKQEPDADISDILTRSQLAVALKQGLRQRISLDVGDLHDLIADQSKMLEMIYAMLSRLTVEILGGTQMEATTRDKYLQRASAVVSAMDSGAVTLRGNFEDMDQVLQVIMQRQSHINELVRDDYVVKLTELVEAI